jgi:hypothetical protein
VAVMLKEILKKKMFQITKTWEFEELRDSLFLNPADRIVITFFLNAVYYLFLNSMLCARNQLEAGSKHEDGGDIFLRNVC